ncbi:unnamed protein product [Sphagnum jensenii]|uniref:Uncharacterized protein n=1 Tax=Sphagnum jensenii TaxID=128206 RepID=A0ABP1BBU9_9BRYO
MKKKKKKRKQQEQEEEEATEPASSHHRVLKFKLLDAENDALKAPDGESKKRRKKRDEALQVEKDCLSALPHEKKKKVKEKNDGAATSSRYTVSIAVAGSIIDNAQSFALATRLAGQIARAAAIFTVDEIVVFDDGVEGSSNKPPKWSEDGSESCGLFLSRILKYMETPQYLRHALIPKHNGLQFAGGLPPLDVPHQARRHEWLPYREGVKVVPPAAAGGSCVNVGLYQDVVIQQSLKPGARVTVAMGSTRPEHGEVRVLEVVPPEEPREKAGLYWGYTVRHTSCLSAVFTNCPFMGGYDYIIGTSEHGQKIRAAEFTIPKFKHLLIVFGGVAGLEESKELDKTIKVADVASLFDIYLNTCPGQGSRTIRTEEAVLISLQYLQDPIMRALDLPFPP